MHAGRNAGRIALAALLAAALVPALAGAQQQPSRQPARRRQQPIEIRGTVPTPQVVTVRPREVPTYSRQVLVPRYYDHDFWPDIQTGYQMVPQRQLTGRTVADSLERARLDSLNIGLPRAATSGAAPAANPGGAAPTPSSAQPTTRAPTAAPRTPATADSTRRPPGTAPAPPGR